MHLALKFVRRLESNLNGSGFVGLQDHVFKATKQGDDPTTCVEPVGWAGPRNGCSLCGERLQGHVECVRCVPNVSNHGVEPAILIRRHLQKFINVVNAGVFLLVHQQVKTPC